MKTLSVNASHCHLSQRERQACSLRCRCSKKSFKVRHMGRTLRGDDVSHRLNFAFCKPAYNPKQNRAASSKLPGFSYSADFINLALFSLEGCNAVFKNGFNLLAVFILNKDYLAVILNTALVAVFGLDFTAFQLAVSPP